MRYKLAADAKPQVTLLVAATVVSVLLWMVSWYMPVVEYVVYPLQLFATFIHESSHALMTLITGNHVMSLTVSPDTSGMVWSQAPWFSSMLISSAGYLGATAFGTLLLVWMRFGYSSRAASGRRRFIRRVAPINADLSFPFSQCFITYRRSWNCCSSRQFRMR